MHDWDGLMKGSPHLIRVFEIPPPTGRFLFGGGIPADFVEVDWFKDALEACTDDMGFFMTPEEAVPLSITTQSGRDYLVSQIKMKNYYDKDKAYLLLHPTHTFTINYHAIRKPDD